MQNLLVSNVGPTVMVKSGFQAAIIVVRKSSTENWLESSFPMSVGLAWKRRWKKKERQEEFVELAGKCFLYAAADTGEG